MDPKLPNWIFWLYAIAGPLLLVVGFINLVLNFDRPGSWVIILIVGGFGTGMAIRALHARRSDST